MSLRPERFLESHYAQLKDWADDARIVDQNWDNLTAEQKDQVLRVLMRRVATVFKCIADDMRRM